MIQKIKKIAVASAVALSVCLCPALMGTTFIYAQPQNAQTENISITNASFNNNPTSQHLETSPAGWTGEKSSTKKGVINTNNSKFTAQAESGYNLSTTENPSAAGDDDKVLMINARKDNASHTNNAALDSFISNQITLEEYSFYKLSVHVKTMNDAKASIILSGLDEQDMLSSAQNAYFSGIKTLDGANWKEYSFYIQTAGQSQKVQLKLALGTITETNQIASSGQAFFDEVSLIKCSEAEFANLYAREQPAKNNFNMIAYDTYDITPDLNLDFENGLENWEMFGTYPNNAEFVAEAKKVADTDLGGDFSFNNTKALYISAEKDNGVHVGFKSEAFDIKMAHTYRISVMTKTADLVGTVSLNLVETEYINETYGTDITPTKTTITVTNTETKQLSNDYQEFVFYVQGYELYDTKAHLEVVFGEEGVPASGSVAVDSIKIAEYSYNKFKNLDSSNKNYKKVTLTSITGSPSLANGSFNSAYSETIGVQYPLTPTEWTQATENQTSCIFGVVNTTAWDQIPSDKRPITTSPLNPAFETTDGTIIPVASDTSNNILMMYNKAAAIQSVSSPTFTASANSFYTLSFNYRTFGNALSIKVLDADGNAVYVDDAVQTTTAWSTYKIMFKTEHFDVETLKVVLELDSTSHAYAFFDNFQFFTANLDNEGFQSAIDAGKNTVDLSNLGIHQTGDLDTTLGIYEAPMFTGNLVNGTQLPSGIPIGFGGIINDENDFGIEFPSTHTNQVQNMLMVQTQAIADYNLTSKNTINLTSGEFYKFSVYIKTSFTTAPTEKENFGAYFGLAGLNDATMTKIVSGTLFNQYIIYLAATETADVQVQFGLTSNTNANQMALFDTFSFEKINQAAFDSAVESNNVMVINDTATAEDEENNPDTENNVGAGLWIQISTIVMVAAIVVAVVGGILRKTKVKKFKAKKHAEYVERVSSVRDAHVVEAEKRRNDEVNTLLKEKEQLAVYLKELEEENKKRLAAQRKVSGKQITRKAEKEFKIYASNRQKIMRDMGRIDDRIKEAQTPEYLARILKLVQNEKVQELEAKDKE
ncbi:MAG: hypothetical protein ACLRFR_01325 [Clostridia bacterium]